MFALVSEQAWRKVVVREGPSLAVSIVIAELLYKFHSFTLECVAFLATWYLLSAVQHFFFHRSA